MARIYDQSGNNLGEVPQQIGVNTATGETIWTDGSVRTADGQIRIAGGTPESVSYWDAFADRITQVATDARDAGKKVFDNLPLYAWLGIGIVVLLLAKETRPEREIARGEYKRLTAKRKRK